MRLVLDVYLHEIHAGQLIQSKSAELTFVYDEAYVQKNKPAISISFPLSLKPFKGNTVKAFFSGILPDDIARHRLAKFLGVSEKNPFALLKAIGGECAGALSLYPEGVVPPQAKDDDAEVLDDNKLETVLELLKRRPLLAGEDGIRLSLAGAQDKIAVGIKNGNITLLRGTSPTTHILKPLITEIKDSVQNELFCMRLAQLMKIEIPDVQIRWLNETPFLLVKRYDRIQKNKKAIERLHQEDFCQALGIMPEIKYEREGGPNIRQCQEILRKYSIQPAVDQLDFLRRIIFNYLIGNADAHGKNFSLLYKDKKPNLAPAYDLLSTAIYEDITTKMAMRIGGKYKPEEVFLRHWHHLVPETKAAQKNLEKQLIKMADDCLKLAFQLRLLLKKEGIVSSIFKDICQVISKRAEHLK